jgi:hypothetical protein
MADENNEQAVELSANELAWSQVAPDKVVAFYNHYLKLVDEPFPTSMPAYHAALAARFFLPVDAEAANAFLTKMLTSAQVSRPAPEDQPGPKRQKSIPKFSQSIIDLAAKLRASPALINSLATKQYVSIPDIIAVRNKMANSAASFLDTHHDTSAVLVTKESARSRIPSDLTHVMDALNVLIEARASTDPTDRTSATEYASIIAYFWKLLSPQGIIQIDSEWRNFIVHAKEPLWPFTMAFMPKLTVLAAAFPKAARDVCLRCGDLDNHSTASCKYTDNPQVPPLRFRDNSRQESASTGQRNARSSHQPRGGRESATKATGAAGDQSCRNWNGKGCNYTACRFKHVCSHCESSKHTAAACDKPPANH